MRTSSRACCRPGLVCANFLAVDVGEHDVEDDAVGAILLDEHASIEAGVGDADVEAAILFENLGHVLDELLDVIVDEEYLALAAFERVGRDAVVLHELIQHVAGDPPEAGAGNPESLELAVVKATE